MGAESMPRCHPFPTGSRVNFQGGKLAVIFPWRSQRSRLGVTPHPKDSSLLQPLSQRRPQPESILLRSVWQAQSSHAASTQQPFMNVRGLKERQLRLRNMPFLNAHAICIFNTATKILPSSTVTKIIQTLLVYSIKFVFVLSVKINVHAVWQQR